MSRSGRPHDAVLYPCSDGQPMAETDLHAACMMYVSCALRRLFERRGREDVYVGSNNFLYIRAGQCAGGGRPGRVRGARGAGASSRHVPAVERAEGAGLRAGGDVGEHATRRREAQARCLCRAGGEGVLRVRPAGGVPDAGVAGLAAARRRVPGAAGGDGAVAPGGGGRERGAGAGASRRARGADGAAARPYDRSGSPHLRGSRPGARGGSHRPANVRAARRARSRRAPDGRSAQRSERGLGHRLNHAGLALGVAWEVRITPARPLARREGRKEP